MTAIIKVSILIAILLNVTVGAASLKIPVDRLISFDQEISRKNVDPMITKIKELYTKDKRDIYIYLDSPGGEVMSGLRFVHEMEKAKAKGIKLICVVDGMAASMAFQFLSECTSRYAFMTSKLLWHPVRVSLFMTTLTPVLSQQLTRDLIEIEAELVNPLKAKLKLAESVFYDHYHRETFHTGLGLKKLTPSYLSIVTDIRNYSEVLEAVKAARPASKKDAFDFGFQLDKKKPYAFDYTYRPTQKNIKGE